MLIRKAERKKAKLRLGISGSSGSGKTWSALEIAKGMGGKIAMIDTESGRGELYGEDFDYDVLRLEAPFSPDRYIQAIKTIENAGYEILIIDSLSHAWAGEGGILSIADASGGSFTNGWKQATPKHNALVNAIITSKLHILITMRTKTEYVLEMNEKGKQVPRKVGMAPIQRDGLEYEFTVFMDISQDHIAHITKDNTKIYDQQFVKPTPEMGIKLIEWLNHGKEEEIKKINDPEMIEEIQLEIPSYIHALENANSLEELQKIFIAARTICKGIPEELQKIIDAKDKSKLKFQGEAA